MSTSPCNETKNEDLPRSYSYALDDFPELHPNSLAPFSDKPSKHSGEIIPVGVSIQSREYNSSQQQIDSDCTSYTRQSKLWAGFSERDYWLTVLMSQTSNL